MDFILIVHAAHVPGTASVTMQCQLFINMVNYKLLATIILWSLVKKAICVTDIVFRSLIEDAQLDISSDQYECFWYYRCPLEDNSRLLTSVAGSDLTLDNGSNIGEYFCWDQQSENTDKLAFVHRGKSQSPTS